MATVVSQLTIEFSSSNNENHCGWLNTDCSRLRGRIQSLGYSLEPHSYGPSFELYYQCQIKEQEGSERLEQVREAILDSGLQECHAAVIPKKLRRTHFAFRHVRTFTKKDLDKAPYIRLNVKGSQRIADWSDTTDAGYLLKANSRLKDNLTFGWLDVVIVPYVSEEGRVHLERQRFQEIEFEPALFGCPEKASKKLYRLTSSVTMPPCLLAIQNSLGEVVCDESDSGERVWDDGGYVLPILKYRREEVEAICPFDIAVTRERVGGLPKHYRHQFIVSQRFRKDLESMNVRGVEFVPVELIDG